MRAYSIAKGGGIILYFLCFTLKSHGWGFYAHQKINYLAVFTLHPEMIVFYKHHLPFIETQAVNPDKRRTILPDEACKHFIDLDAYSDTIKWQTYYWDKAITLIPEDTLKKHGIVPWHILAMKYQLTEAFRQKAVDKILRISADLGHYAADANVPLHTTTNYNGQLTNQHGIHGFWESRLPELYSEQYSFFVGKALYLEQPSTKIWEGIYAANQAVDSVLLFEKKLTSLFPVDKKFAFENRNNVLTKVYASDFAKAYHDMLNGQVERQMRSSILLVGSLWYTAWIDAGQPDLNELLKNNEKNNTVEEVIEKGHGEDCKH